MARCFLFIRLLAHKTNSNHEVTRTIILLTSFSDFSHSLKKLLGVFRAILHAAAHSLQ